MIRGDIGVRHRPAAWCVECGDPYPLPGVCPCERERPSAQTRALLAELYPQSEPSALEPSALELERWRL